MSYHNRITSKNNIMFDSEDNDYGFFCELDQDIKYNQKNNLTVYKELPPIREESMNELYNNNVAFKFNNNMYFQNMKNAFIDNLNFKCIFLYILISFSSFYITSRYFNKNHN